MAQQKKCPQCGRDMPPDTAQGLCAACLLKRGLESNTLGESGGQKPSRWNPPSVQELAGSFPELDILELIGRGGMGAVYKARQKELDRLVALKILPPEIGRDEAFAQRFAREAQAMARLSHPNIVTIHNFGSRSTTGVPPVEAGENRTGETPVPPDLYFFLMEYVDGLSLRQVLNSGGVSPKEALAIVPQICDALQYAHDRGIVHRDIKPENILLNRSGQVKIADFGLAKLVGLGATPKRLEHGGAALDTPNQTAVGDGTKDGRGITQDSGKVMGTPQYMAPEQIEHPGEVDHRADIYSLGVVFYQMLTGELPKGPEKFEPPSHKVLIDVRLDEVVLRALEKEPARRYQQVSEVRTQVETIVATSPGSPGGTGVSPVTSTSVEAQRRPFHTFLPFLPQDKHGMIWRTGPLWGVLTGLLVGAIMWFSDDWRNHSLWEKSLGSLGIFVMFLIAGPLFGLVLWHIRRGRGATTGAPNTGATGASPVMQPQETSQSPPAPQMWKWMSNNWIPVRPWHRFVVVTGMRGGKRVVNWPAMWHWFAFAAMLVLLGITVMNVFSRDLVPLGAVLIGLGAVSLWGAIGGAATLNYWAPERLVPLDPLPDQTSSSLAPEQRSIIWPVALCVLGLVWAVFWAMVLELYHGPALTLVALAGFAAIELVAMLVGIGARRRRGATSIALVSALLAAGALAVGGIYVRGQNVGPTWLVDGRVTDSVTGRPICFARVADDSYGATPSRPAKVTLTDGDGRFFLGTWPEEHNIVVSATGYQTKEMNVRPQDATGPINVALQPIGKETTSGGRARDSEVKDLEEELSELEEAVVGLRGKGAREVHPAMVELRGRIAVVQGRLAIAKRQAAKGGPWTGEPKGPEPLPVGQTASYILKPLRGQISTDWPVVDLDLGREIMLGQSVKRDFSARLSASWFTNQPQSLVFMTDNAELRGMPKGADTAALWKAPDAQAALDLAAKPGSFHYPDRQAPYVLAYKTKLGQVGVIRVEDASPEQARISIRLLASEAATQPPTRGALTPWTVDGRLPTALAHMGAAPVEGGLLLFGGVNGANECPTASFIYKPGGTIVKAADMPANRNEMAMASCGGKAYSISGYLEGQGVWGRTTDVWSYEPTKDKWETQPSLAYERATAAGAAVGRYIYSIGGHHEDTGHGFSIGRVERLDTDGGKKWETMASLRHDREALGAAVVGGKIYAIGGLRYDYPRVMHTFEGWLEIYDPNTDTWSDGPRMLTPRSELAVAVVGNRIYALGGCSKVVEGSLAESDAVEYYDVKEGAWHADRPLPLAMRGCQASAIGNHIYLLGGKSSKIQESNGRQDIVYVAEVSGSQPAWQPARGKGAKAMEDLPDMSAPHGSGGVAACKDKLYVWAGYRDSDRISALEVYDPNCGSWKKGADMPESRTGIGCFVLGGRIYSIGGEASSSGSFSADFYRYDPAKERWATLKPFSRTTWDPMCVVCAGKAYLLGGRAGYGGTCPDVFVYNDDEDAWKPKADMPKSVMRGGVASVGGKIYVFGGAHKESEAHNEHTQLLQVYDPTKDSWTTRQMPWRLSMPQAVAWNEDIWLFSRYFVEDADKTTPCRWAFRYSPATGRWAKSPLELPEETTLVNPLAAIQGQMYLTGFYGQKWLPKVTRIDLDALARELVAQPATQPISRPAAATDKVIVEDLGLAVLVAIRDKDDASLKALATDRIKGWPDALPPFALEMRERFRQMTGKPFDMQVGESLVAGDVAAVKCTGPKELKGTYLALLFVKTDKGWKNFFLRNSPPSAPLEAHLRTAAKQIGIQLPATLPDTQPAGVQPDYSRAQELARVFASRPAGGLYELNSKLVQEGQANLPGLVGLVQIGDPGIVEPYGLRQWENAAEILGRIGDRRAAPFLLDRFWRIDQPEWRLVRALGELGAGEIVPDLVQWLHEDRHWEVDSQAYGSHANYMLDALQKVTGKDFGAAVRGAVDANAKRRKEILSAIDEWWQATGQRQYEALANAAPKPGGPTLLVLHAAFNATPETMASVVAAVLGGRLVNEVTAADMVQAISWENKSDIYVRATKARPRALLAEVRLALKAMTGLPVGAAFVHVEVLGPRAQVPQPKITQVQVAEFVIDRDKARAAGINVSTIQQLVRTAQTTHIGATAVAAALEKTKLPISGSPPLASVGKIRIVTQPDIVVLEFLPAPLSTPSTGLGRASSERPQPATRSSP